MNLSWFSLIIKQQSDDTAQLYNFHLQIFLRERERDERVEREKERERERERHNLRDIHTDSKNMVSHVEKK